VNQPLPVDAHAAIRNAMNKADVIRHFRQIQDLAEERAERAVKLAMVSARLLTEETLVVIPEVDRVIYVKPGAPPRVACAKCESRGLEAELGRVPNYTHQFTNPEVVFEWQVGLAHELVKASGREPVEVKDEVLLRLLTDHSNLTPGHWKHLPVEATSEPILMDVIFMGAEDGGQSGPMVPCVFLIDGHHTAARNLIDGRRTVAHLLAPDEHARVVIRHDGAFDPEAVNWKTLEETRVADAHNAPHLNETFRQPFRRAPLADRQH
jgi:hypothetical protein